MKYVFRYVEAEIYDYPETLKEIDILREVIVKGYQQEEQVCVHCSPDQIQQPPEQLGCLWINDLSISRK